MELMVGAVLGFLSGLGIGGGSLLILYLTLVLGLGPETARGINLLFYLPCAGIAALIRWKEGSVDLKKLLPAIIAGCAAAAVCTLIAARADTDVLQKWFGWLLLATGLRELFYKSKRL